MNFLSLLSHLSQVFNIFLKSSNLNMESKEEEIMQIGEGKGGKTHHWHCSSNIKEEWTREHTMHTFIIVN